jgi:hypothetical protein
MGDDDGGNHHSSVPSQRKRLNAGRTTTAAASTGGGDNSGNNSIARGGIAGDRPTAVRGDADDPTNEAAATMAGTGTADAAAASPSSSASSLSVEKALSPLTIVLNGLTATEREKALFDIHGVSDPPEEDPLQISDWIDEMWTDHLPLVAQDHPGLALAMQTSPQYVRKERLKFLRAEGNYDRIAASERMGHYFDLKLQYFGDAGMGHCACIGRDLTLQDDFTDQELEHIKTRFFQLCEERDRSGRIVTIVVPHPMIRRNIPVSTIAKFFMYGCQVLTRDESVQRIGKVHLVWGLGLLEDDSLLEGLHNVVFDQQNLEAIGHCNRYLPLRCVAKHFCLDDPSLQELLDRWSIPMAPFTAARVRAHYGSQTDCLYELMTVGISTESLPLIGDDGEVDVDFHLGILEALMRLEEVERQKQKCSGKTWDDQSDDDGEESSAKHLAFPGPKDVIMGKGEHNRKNPGNLRFKLILEEHYDDYERATLVQRKTIVDGILRKVKEAGSRFLYQESVSNKQDRQEQPGTITAEEDSIDGRGGGLYRWIEASAEKARDKVTHDFRNLRRAEHNHQHMKAKKEKREFAPP